MPASFDDTLRAAKDGIPVRLDEQVVPGVEMTSGQSPRRYPSRKVTATYIPKGAEAPVATENLGRKQIADLVATNHVTWGSTIYRIELESPNKQGKKWSATWRVMRGADECAKGTVQGEDRIEADERAKKGAWDHIAQLGIERARERVPVETIEP